MWQPSIIECGIFGVALPDIIGLIRFQKKTKRPKYMKGWYYWLIMPVKLCAGFFVFSAYVAYDPNIKPITAIQLGASTPLIMNSFQKNIHLSD